MKNPKSAGGVIDAAGLAAAVKAARTARGLTQFQLAVAAGVSPGFVSRLERAAPCDPPWSLMLRLANALEISLDRLAYPEPIKKGR